MPPALAHRCLIGVLVLIVFCVVDQEIRSLCELDQLLVAADKPLSVGGDYQTLFQVADARYQDPGLRVMVAMVYVYGHAAQWYILLIVVYGQHTRGFIRLVQHDPISSSDVIELTLAVQILQSKWEGGWLDIVDQTGLERRILTRPRAKDV
jgi:hypothetical protein